MKYFFPLALTGICLGLLIDFHFLSEEVFYSHLSDKFTYTRIQNMLEFRGKWLWLTYVIAPIGLFVKIVIPASLIYMGLYLSNFKVSFNDVLRACTIAEFIFLLPIISKILWFWLVTPNYTLDEFRGFYPLSLFAMFEPDLLDKWLHYPFKTINVFEIAYWFALAGSLSLVLSIAFQEMFRIVVLYYGSYLVCWMLFVVFISLSIN